MSTNSPRRHALKNRVRVEHTPNGGKIVRSGKFTIMDRAGLDHYCDTDPVERLWPFVDQLIDRRLLPYPDLPVYDAYNRPGYPYGDPKEWTPQAAIERYGCHLVH